MGLGARETTARFQFSPPHRAQLQKRRPQPERVSFSGTNPPPLPSGRTVSLRVWPSLTVIALAHVMASLASFWRSAVSRSCGRRGHPQHRSAPQNTSFALSFSESCGRLSGRECFERTTPVAYSSIVKTVVFSGPTPFSSPIIGTPQVSVSAPVSGHASRSELFPSPQAGADGSRTRKT